LDSPTPAQDRKGSANRRPKKRRGAGRLPDLLYHACSVKHAGLAKVRGELKAGKGNAVFLSSNESRTWRIAHRLRHEPMVIVVDVRRAVRDGVRFRRGKNGLYLADSLPFSCLISMHEGFKEQHSAGGFLVRQGENGMELCLVACRRRSGKSWEIAKGKMEAGETPAATAIRELQEEMGFEADVSVVEALGMVRYVFTTPNKEIRLKAMHLFLLKATPCPESFSPANDEGIVEVAWLPVSEARARVFHSSLRPVLRELDRRFGSQGKQGAENSTKG
jgi:8-oxo-dGTP pyrophosphatase MutT (NUDIX family)